MKHLCISIPTTLTLCFILGCKKKVTSPKPAAFQKIPLERLVGSPPLSGELPSMIQISPDGKKITFLKGKKEDTQTLDLWEYTTENGEPRLLVDSSDFLEGGKENISDAERAQRERKRINSKGIISYQWSKDGNQILFPMNGDLYLYKMGQDNPVQKLTQNKTAALDPRLSPQGQYVSFVRNHNVYLIDLKSGKEKQLTFAGKNDQPIGTAEFIAQEEMRRFKGYWWSPDEKYIAVTRVDERPVLEMQRFEIYTDKVQVVKQRYPRTGTKNAIVELQIYKLSKAGTLQTPIKVPIKSKDYYVPQVRWTLEEPEPRLFYSLQNREQTEIDFFLFDPKSKNNQLLFTEKDDAWVNIRQDFKFIKDKPWLVWVSDRSGFNHLERISLLDGSRTPLTGGDWDVSQIEGYSRSTDEIFYSSHQKDPLETHLYAVNPNEVGSPRQISQGQGVHRIVMAETPRFYLDYYSSPSHPNSVAVHDLDGNRKFFIDENRLDENHPLYPYLNGLSKWDFQKFERENNPDLYYTILKPKNFDPFKKYPVIQYVYGGPSVQMVDKSWSARRLFFQILAQNGFVVVIGDNRGTPGRGRDFEKAYKNNFGVIDVEDQSTLISHLIKKHSFIDHERVGVFGHSYGGYLTLMLMMQKPDLYKVGVAGAPVVDWSLYDTHYTERYIGTPDHNPEDYKTANVLTYVDQLKGSLLVAHGMADDNVLYSHSLMLYSTLQEKGKLFDIQAYPGAKHGIRRKKSWEYHYQLSILNYFKKNL